MFQLNMFSCCLKQGTFHWLVICCGFSNLSYYKQFLSNMSSTIVWTRKESNFCGIYFNKITSASYESQMKLYNVVSWTDIVAEARQLANVTQLVVDNITRVVSRAPVMERVKTCISTCRKTCFDQAVLWKCYGLRVLWLLLYVFIIIYIFTN